MATSIFNWKKSVVTLAIALAATAGAQAQLSWSGTQTLTSGQVITQSITLTGNVTINVASGNAEIKGVISGNYSVTKTGAGTLSLSGTNNYNGGTFISAGKVDLTAATGSVLGNIDISSGAILNFNRSNDYTFSGVISGAGNVTKEGAGKTTLTGINAYTGSTTVSGSTLQIGDGTSGSIANTANVALNNANAILRFEPGADMTFSKVISGSGKVECKVLTGNVLYFNADNNYSGTTTIESGNLFLGDNSATGSVASDIINNGALFFYRTTDYIFPKVISGTGAVYKYNANKVTLTGANNYTSSTIIDNGTLQIGNGTSGSIAGTFDVQLSKTTSILRFEPGANMIFDKVISGNGKVEYKGTTSTRLMFTADNNYSGTTTIEAGDFYIGNNTTTGNVASNISLGSTNSYLNFDRSDDYTYTGVISGTGMVFKGYLGETSKTILTGINNYTGRTTVSEGTLQIGNGTSGGSIAGTSDVVLTKTTSILRFVPKGNFIFSAPITGAGSVQKAAGGDVGFTADNSYKGTTTIEAGSLWIGNNSATGSIAGDIIINDGAWLDFRRSNNYVYSGVISGTGNINRYNAGIVTLNGINTFTGETRIQEGTLALGTNGSVENSSDVHFNSSTAKFDISVGDKTIKALNGNGEVILGANTLTIGTAGQTDGDGIFPGKFSGTGNVIKQGTGAFFNGYGNTATGTFTLKEGFLSMSNWEGNLIQNAGTVWQVSNLVSVRGNLALNGGNISMDLTNGSAPILTVGGAVSTSGTTTFKIAADAVINNYTLMEVTGGGITGITPYSLDMPYMTGALSVQSPTKLLLNGQIVPRCEIVGGSQYNSLNSALNAITNNTHTTIKLLDNITNDGVLDIYDRNITFDLNGKDLILAGDYIYLYGYSVVDYTGAGNFKSIVNIQTTDTYNNFYPVDVENGSTLKLMSVDVTYTGGTNNSVLGIYCSGASNVLVNGDVKVTYSGNYAEGIEIHGGNSTVTVAGSVTAADEGIYANCSAGTARVNVSGDVNVANGYGVFSYDNTAITIDGKINAASYISLNENDYTAADGIADPAKPNYLKYTDGTAIVWVGNKATAIDEITADELRIYPNPVKDYLRFTNYEGTIKNVEIVDLSGKTLMSQPSLSSPINVSHLPSGIYFVKITTDNGTITRKFVKE